MDSFQGELRPLSEVHLDAEALSHNLKIALGLANGRPLTAVIKADAYGHGAVWVARQLQGHLKGFAVAHPAEAVRLRNSGITAPVQVLCPPEQEWSGIYTHNGLIATAGSVEALAYLPAGTEVHLKFNTGMNRIGFRPEETSDVLEMMRKRTDLHFTGLMSHFANADIPGHASVPVQLETFKAISAQFPDTLIRHMANSAATTLVPEAHFDMVRSGLLLYGYQPETPRNLGLKPIKRWVSRITQVKQAKKGDMVSYGWTWECPSDGWLGIVPAGYADGYPRNLGNRASVDLSDGPARIAGNVTMDYTVIWSPNRPLVIGEEVTLLGGPNTGADTLAKHLGTILYELMSTTGHVRYMKSF